MKTRGNFSKHFWLFMSLGLVFQAVANDNEVPNESARENKLLPVFTVVRFPNDICAGTTRNGTCYTAEECTGKGGTSEGTCASGFGVCCIMSIACGGSSSENITYMVQTAVTSLSSPCTYSICPCSSNICRIRYDFISFSIADPVQGTTAATGSLLDGGAIGDCTTDTFTVTAPGGAGSPVICGKNGGYHMILDSDGSQCQKATFNIGSSTTTSRTYDIRVTQYACGDTDSSGWPGCLQYYTATTSFIQSFNFPTSTTTYTSKTTHLSNQKYDICIRRASGYCYICYTAIIASGTAGVINQNSFGVSIADADGAKSQVGTSCISDYLEIPFGIIATIVVISAPGTTATHVHRYCGRIHATSAAATANISICSRQLPFTVGVNFDGNELTAAIAKAESTETDTHPGGIIGFKLKYVQGSC